MIKVKLRQKAITGNRHTLYLDFYPPIPHPETGVPTRREFLGMYLTDKAKSSIDKQYNKELLNRAEQIRQLRENYLNKPEIYTGYEKEQLKIKERGEQNFVVYFKSLADKRKSSNYDNWISAYNYLDAYTKGCMKFSDLNECFFEDFKKYLLTAKSNKSAKTTLSNNSAASYFLKVKAALKQAYKDGYFTSDLNSKIQPIKQEETKRSFLTIEELNTLIKTECNNPVLKRAAIFSALTGLRFSDINNLVWNEIEYIEGDGYLISFTQQKTKGVERLPISEQAYSFLGECQGPTDKVFEGLTYSAYENKHLGKWIGLAGITKDITFHCFRHTFATLQLSHGTDIYTVSKMLGHRELKTTQIYAKVIDQSKRDAVNRISVTL
jgi:integrase